MITLRRVVLSIVLAGAVVLIGLGFSTTEEPNPKVKITDAAVREVFPGNGDLDLRQSEIGFQLDPLYTGRLVIDGTPIPDDQVVYQAGVNTWTYHPGPGTETGALRPGRHTAQALFWRRDQDESKSRSLTWTFNSH